MLNPLPVDDSLGRTYAGGRGSPKPTTRPVADATPLSCCELGDSSPAPPAAESPSGPSLRPTPVYAMGSTSGRRAVDGAPVAVRSVEPLASRRAAPPREPNPSIDAKNAACISCSCSPTALSVVSIGIDMVRCRIARSLERADSDSSWMVDVRVWAPGPTGDSRPLDKGLCASISCTKAEISASSGLPLKYAGTWHKNVCISTWLKGEQNKDAPRSPQC